MEFLYKAYADSGEVKEGRVAAAGKREAADELKSRGLHPMTIRKTGEKKKVSLFKRRRLADLAEEWESLLSAGIPVTETLDILGGGRSGKEKILLGEIKATIEAGHSIAESFAGSRAFPPFFTALLQVGELSGTIPEQLRLAAACYRKEEEFIAGMKSALSYPVFVLFFSFLVFALILTVILPSFAALFGALDIPLPAVTRAALALGLFLQEKGFYFLVELLLGAVGGIVWLRSERGKRSTDAFLFRFPFIRRLYLIRVTLALSALLKSGKTLSDALADIADITDNGAVKEELLKIKKDIERGGDFAQSMERSFGDTALARMIHVGMESGRLPLFLERSAHLMTEETKRKLTRFRKILEPSLLLFVGLVTAAIIFSVLLPVFSAVGTHMGV